MNKQFTAVYTKHGKWCLGWVEEIPGVNTQGRTLREVKANLRDALVTILEVNRSVLLREMPRGKIIREPVTVTTH